MTIEIPYDRAAVPMGITEDDLVPSYYDTSTESWRKLDGYVVDKANQRIIVLVDHFSDFDCESVEPISFATYIPVVPTSFSASGW